MADDTLTKVPAKTIRKIKKNISHPEVATPTAALTEVAALSQWDKLKAFFKYSETIFWARMQTITGLLTGALGAIDWTSLFNADFQNLIANKTILYVAAGIFFNGLWTEYLRRRNLSE